LLRLSLVRQEKSENGIYGILIYGMGSVLQHKDNEIVHNAFVIPTKIYSFMAGVCLCVSHQIRDLLRVAISMLVGLFVLNHEPLCSLLVAVMLSLSVPKIFLSTRVQGKGKFILDNNVNTKQWKLFTL
jgi:hypothetical protein